MPPMLKYHECVCLEGFNGLDGSECSCVCGSFVGRLLAEFGGCRDKYYT